MSTEEIRPSGHVQIVERASGRRWHALWRDADGRHQRVLGAAWVKDSGRRTPRGAIVWRAADGPKPDPSYLSPTGAEDLLRQILAAAPRKPTRARPGSGTRLMDVAEDWMLHGERKRGLKRGTLRDYRYTLRTHLLPAFGEQEIGAISRRDIEGWHSQYPRSRTAEKVLVVLGAIMRYAQRRDLIAANPVEKVERHPFRYSGDYDIYSREEVDALVRSAAGDQDAAIFLTAALTGLRRGELLALRWRDVDFPGQAIRVRANLSYGELVTPKSGKVRVVPMVDLVAQRLARLAYRPDQIGEDDPVFASPLGGRLDASALRRRYAAAAKRAGLRSLPFHSLRHFFGSTAVNKASLVQVQAWMGHAHIQTTARYLHHKTQQSDAALLATAFAAGLERAGGSGDASAAQGTGDGETPTECEAFNAS
jgi:integrase